MILENLSFNHHSDKLQTILLKKNIRILNESVLLFQKRSAEIQNFRQQKLARRGILALLLSTDMSYKPFEMKEVSYSVIGPYCLPHHTQVPQVWDSGCFVFSLLCCSLDRTTLCLWCRSSSCQYLWHCFALHDISWTSKWILNRLAWIHYWNRTKSWFELVTLTWFSRSQM